MDQVFSFLLWPKHEAHGPWKQGRKKRGSITCRTDRANEANKMFIIWLCWLFWIWKGDRELGVRTATYGPGIDQSQHAKSVSHIIRGIYTRKLLMFLFTDASTVWCCIFITDHKCWNENKLYRIFRCISRLFNTKNLLPKVVLDLYTDQKIKQKLRSLKLYKNVWNQ